MYIRAKSKRTMKCCVCNAPTQRVCGACKLFPYCSVNCQQSDWEIHAIEEHITDDSDALNRVYVDGNTKGEVWIGGIEALPVLSQYHIDAVVTVMHKRSRPANEQRMKEMIGNKPHVRYVFYDEPEAQINIVFAASAAFIDKHVKQGHRVLVHCYGGISRSVTLVINYLRTYHRSEFPTVQGALEYIRKNRPQANPNKGFISQLEEQ